ncbi:MAG: dihydroorotate dehydrogenase electron transfer subunit [Caulobacteraceae bacterium]
MNMHGECKVIANKELCRNIYELIIENKGISETAKPGQFLHIKTNSGLDPLLRRPISISRVDREKGHLSLIYQLIGRGTRELSELLPGSQLDVMGPLGNGFPILSGKRCAVVGGGMGVAPLLELLNNLSDCDAYIGFKCSTFKVDDYRKASSNLYIATEDGSTGSKGFVTDLLTDIGRYDVVYTCGPRPMMKKVKELCEKASVECFVSVEERMGCGIGACLVCACKTKERDGSWHYKKACTDGPVFRAEEVAFDD